jgi:DNA invertase Pin-like site-specific DNA recombinase
VAQAERAAISKPTKEALAIARGLGVKLGNPQRRRRLGSLAMAERRYGRRSRVTPTSMRRTSHRSSRTFEPEGGTSLRAIAEELNARGMLTRRGGRWHVSTVTNLLDRLGLREAACASPG